MFYPNFFVRDQISARHVINVPYAKEHMGETAGMVEFWVDTMQLEFGTEATEFKTE